MNAHTFAFEGHKAAIADKAMGFTLPCYVANYHPEFQRTYCAAYGYNIYGHKLAA